MSRIGKQPVKIPAGVEVTQSDHQLTVKGPKGTLVKELHPDMNITVENGEIRVTRPSDEKEHRSLHGLTRTLIANMIEGVTKGLNAIWKSWALDIAHKNKETNWFCQSDILIQWKLYRKQVWK